MKRIFKVLRWIHDFTNHTVPLEIEADSLYNCMAYKSDPIRTLRVFEALEKRMELEMRLEEKRCSSVCRIINTKYQKQPEILNMKVIDPVFEKPIKN